MPPTIEPGLPDGCTSIPLLDDEGTVLAGSASGLVRCPERGAPSEDVYSIFRTGPVVCEFAVGDCQCDADCPLAHQCICSNASIAGFGTPGNRCLPADCASDDDCVQGQRCRAEVLFCGSYDIPVGLYCTSDEDDCDSHTACINQGRQYCAYDQAVEIFTCSPGAVCE